MASTDRKPPPESLGKPPGRPSLYGERMRDHSMKFTDAQWAAFLKLGGSQWLREQIELATRQENGS